MMPPHFLQVLCSCRADSSCLRLSAWHILYMRVPRATFAAGPRGTVGRAWAVEELGEARGGSGLRPVYLISPASVLLPTFHVPLLRLQIFSTSYIDNSFPTVNSAAVSWMLKRLNRPLLAADAKPFPVTPISMVTRSRSRSFSPRLV